MIFSNLRSLFLAAAVAVSVVQRAQTVTVCSAGECLEGQSDITRLGAVLSSPSGALILLPGQYTAGVQPTSLSQSLTSATSTLTFTNGFSNSTTPTTPTLPLNIALLPGLLYYPSDRYKGDPKFIAAPQSANVTFNATGITRGSIIVAANTVATIEANNNGVKNRIVLWDTVPFVSQLPYSMAGELQVLSIQSSTCSPACSSSAICSAGTCVCPAGFTGSSCEACADGFWGPQCKPCPTGCGKCDKGITGTGVCLSPPVPAGAPSTCNCTNGVCSGNTCTCSPGWTTSGGTNSTQCNTCADGFFLSSSGNCESCGSRCNKCLPTSGQCTECAPGLTPSSFQNQICGVAQQCADGQFSSGNACAVCNVACATCNGPASTDCLKCAAGTFFLNGTCVRIGTVPASGVCTGSTLVANPLKNVCDTCPLGCSACQYDVFGPASTYADVKCSKCIPGQFLSGGKCSGSCPDGTFVGSDGFTCTPCASGCATCTSKADFCLTCKNNQLASAGACVSTCPTNNFASRDACTSCHPDCLTCSGPSFNQCSSCSPSAPVLTSGGRCVQRCSKSEYLDSSSGTCKACDSSCSSCSGGGANACMACANAKQVLRAGTCSTANCGNGSGTTSGLGVCLSELVVAPGAPPSDIPPLDPNAQQPSTGGGGLIWWQILLIVLGILFILILILVLWRRHARKKRAQETEQFKRNLKKQGLWGKLWRNPFSAWWARRKSARLARRSQDVERMSHAQDWKSNDSSADRRTAIGVPKSISRGSWVTMGQHTDRRPSIDGRSYLTNNAGLGAIHETRSYRESDYPRSHGAPSARDNGRYRNGAPSRYTESRREDSRYYGQEVEQEDSRSERTYDPYQYPRPDSRGSETRQDDRGDLISIIQSEYTEGDRYDDRRFNDQRRGTRDDRSRRHDYPTSVSSRAQSSRYGPRDDQRSYGRGTRVGMDTPSMYSRQTDQPPLLPANVFDDRSTRDDPVLSSRFSMSTTAASVQPNSRRKKAPTEPLPDSKPRQLTDAEMYKLSKINWHGDIFGLMSPTKKHQQQPAVQRSPSRNPFRI